jgi:hypothetical protein
MATVTLNDKVAFQASQLHTDDSPVAALDALSDYGAPSPLVVDGVEQGDHYLVNRQHIFNVFVDHCAQPPLVLTCLANIADQHDLPSVEVVGLHHRTYVKSPSSALVEAVLTFTTVWWSVGSPVVRA